MLEELKQRVYEANMLLPKHNLVISTWGNVSEIDRKTGYFVIKPSGVKYDQLKPENMVVCDLEGNVIEGSLNPSSDTPTHIALYKSFDSINAIVHTHSHWATVFSQAGKKINAYGTTHADYFYGPIPVTRRLTDEEINGDYEYNTGKLIADTFKLHKVDPLKMPACLVNSHGPFVWGTDAFSAVDNALYLEEIAHLAWHTEMYNSKRESATLSIQQTLLSKHFNRKHGDNAYYGQK